MFNFKIQIRPGKIVSEEIAYSLKKAIVSGKLAEGEKLPSVRALSKEFNINPNTTQKIIKILESEGLVISTPGIGSIVARPAVTSEIEIEKFLGDTLDRFVVESKCRGITLDEIQARIKKYWKSPNP